MAVLQPEDIVDAPELLVLASLEPTLHTLPVALVAAYPELLNELGRQRDPPLVAAARRLLACAHRLELSVGRYRADLERARTRRGRGYDDLPF
jgi:hypothetical protein